MIRIPRLPLLLPLVVAAPLGAAAQTLSTSSYACRFVEVPVRDGVHLHTSICAPRSTQEKLPFLLTRTPYGIGGDTVVGESYRFLAADGYIFVGQDIRGRYGSEGQWSMNRPLHDPADSAGVDEATDTYDTVEWLLKNVPDNNGRLGALGVSYPGFLATMAGINPHPAVKAISPQAPMTDTWMGDDFFHQGAFRLSYGFEYSADLELSKDESVALPIGTWDTYDWYLRSLGPLSGVDGKFFQGRNHTWSSFVAHPTYDAYWQAPCSAGSPRQRSPRSPWAAGGTRRTATVRWPPTARSSGATPGTGTRSSWVRGTTAAGAGASRGGWRWWIRARRRATCGTSRRRGSPTGSRTRAS
jgi:predicted acyl esterase